MQNILLFRGNEFNANFYYYTKLDVDNSFYLKIGENEILFVPKLNERVAKLAFKGEVHTYKKSLKEIVQFARGNELFLDYSSISAEIYDKLRKFLKIKNASDKLLKIRAVKKPEELKKIRKAVSFTKKILSEIEFSEFKNEKSLSDRLLMHTFELGLKPAFDPIVGSGIHSAFPHYRYVHTKIRDFVLIDYGVRYENYCSDITRVFFRKKEKKIINAYEKMQCIFNEIIDSFSNFETGKDVTLFSKNLFKKYALPKSIHSIGHGVGLDIHEYPRLNMKYSDLLKGTVIAIEPAAYFKNFGVRFEEIIYFDGKKARVF